VTQNNANPYQTIERKEVGVKLRIKPQINIDNSVRLDIVQEVSSIADPARPAT
jgi:general secretion pathway protein D